MPGQSGRLRHSLLLIVLVALALRLILVAFLYPEQLNPRRDHWPFGYETGRIARAIVSGRGFSDPLFAQTGPTAWMPPVYPYLVAGVFKLFGIFTATSAIVLLSLNSLFSALTCIPTFFIAQKSFDSRVAAWAAWAWAFFPYAIFLPADLVWETCLTTLLLSLLFLFTLHLDGATRLAAWIGFGLLWGFAALTDANVLSVLPGLGGWVCYRLHRRGQPWALRALAAGLALVIVVSPWFIRNYRTFHRFIPFRDVFGLVLHLGNNGDTSHWDPDSAHPSTNDRELEEFNRLGELPYMAAKGREATAFIAAHPGWTVWVAFRRFVFTWTGFWSFDPNYLAEEPFDPPNIVLCTTLTLLSLAGLLRAFRLGNEFAAPYAFLLLFFPLLFYPTHSEMRYRHRIDPYLIVLAACAVTNWRSQHRKLESVNFAGDKHTELQRQVSRAQ